MADEEEEGSTYVTLEETKEYLRSRDMLETITRAEERINDELATSYYPGDELVTLGMRLERYDDIIERAEAALKSMKARRRVLAEERIPDVMRNRGLVKNNGTGNYGLPSGCKVSLRNSTKPGIKKERLSEAYMWLSDGGFVDVMYVSWGGKYKVGDLALLNAVKTLRKAGRNVPPFIDTFEITKAVIISPRKGNDKGENDNE